MAKTLETCEMRDIIFRDHVTLFKLFFLLELQFFLLLNEIVGSRPCFPKFWFTGGKRNMTLGGNIDCIFKILVTGLGGGGFTFNTSI